MKVVAHTCSSKLLTQSPHIWQ